MYDLVMHVQVWFFSVETPMQELPCLYRPRRTRTLTPAGNAVYL